MPTTAQQYALSLRRKDFVGRTDKYARIRKPSYTNLSETLESHGFLDIPNTDTYDELWKETTLERLNRYKRNIEFYQGDHWAHPWDNGEPKPVFNFCRPIIDRGTDFFLGKELFVFDGPTGTAPLTKALNMIWDANNKYSLCAQSYKAGSICGDSYLYVTVNTKSKEGIPLTKDLWTVRLYFINPQYVHPKWADQDKGIMESVLIQVPTEVHEEGTRITESLFITNRVVRHFYNEQLVSENPNPFGEINLVHFPNEVQPDTPFGVSDLDHIIPLNEEYNSISNSIRKVIKYHAEPTTLIFGARASDLEKGANKVWSGFPIDAKVENLELQGDLGVMNNYLGNIEEMIYKLSSTPKQTFLIDQGISNTSGLALQVTYQPILDKTRRKQFIFDERSQEVNRLIFKAMDVVIGIPEVKGANIEEALEEIHAVFSSPLPRDLVAELDAAQKRITMGISSKIKELRKLNNTEDVRRLLLEIMSDKMGELAMTKEKTAAMEGREFDLTAVLMDSIGSAEDFTGMLGQLKSTAPKPQQMELEMEDDDADE